MTMPSARGPSARGPNSRGPRSGLRGAALHVAFFAGVLVLGIGCGSGAQREAAIEKLRTSPLLASTITTPGVIELDLFIEGGSSSLGKDTNPAVTRRFDVPTDSLNAVVEELISQAEAEGWVLERSASGAFGWPRGEARDTRLVIGGAARVEDTSSAWLTLIAQNY